MSVERPNADAARSVATHYNQIEDAGLAKRNTSRIIHMRNFNNWVKSMLINEALGRLRRKKGESFDVLDLCSGKGGDLLKWKIGEIDYLVCADIAETSVDQSKGRYNELIERTKRDRNPKPPFKAEFIVADCSKERLKTMYKNKNQQFDITSCQFAIHYAFGSIAQAERMIENACECLKPGGIFVGTTTNSYEMVKRLREVEDMSFQNDVYKVDFDLKNKTEIPLFGAKYNFYLDGVVNCPEYLVYFPLLEELASKHNMKLLFRMTFKEFHEKNSKTEEGRTLLKKMKALECYHPNKCNELSGVKSDYIHADKFLKENPGVSHVATLSLSEWEATNLYLVFAFQKNVHEPCSEA